MVSTAGGWRLQAPLSRSSPSAGRRRRRRRRRPQRQSQRATAVALPPHPYPRQQLLPHAHCRTRAAELSGARHTWGPAASSSEAEASSSSNASSARASSVSGVTPRSEGSAAGLPFSARPASCTTLCAAPMDHKRFVVSIASGGLLVSLMALEVCGRRLGTGEPSGAVASRRAERHH